MSTVQLNELPEPDRSFWITRALVGQNAEVEARETNYELNKPKAKS
jgi:hypothetical protein